MPSYYYSSTAGTYTLTGAVNASATILVLDSVTGLPASAPFKVVLEPGQPGEEIVKVTAVAGTSLTVVRGWDGTSATAHGAGSTVRHMVTAEDFTLSRSHEDATVAHGATGAVVGTTNAQSLSYKDLSNGTNTFPAALLTATGSQTVTNKDLSSATNVLPPSVATLTGAQALTNKDLTAGTNTFPTSLARSAGQAFTGNVTAPNLPASSASKAGKRMHWVTASGTTNSSALVTINHNAGFTPTTVTGHGNANDETGRFISVFNITSSDVTLRITNGSGSGHASSPITVSLFLGE